MTKKRTPHPTRDRGGAGKKSAPILGQRAAIDRERARVESDASLGPQRRAAALETLRRVRASTIEGAAR